MKLLSYYQNGRLNIGIQTEKGIFELSKARAFTTKPVPQTVDEIIEGNADALGLLTDLVNQALQTDQSDLFLNEEDVQLGPCIPNPGKIICVGLNYRKHAEESNMPIPESPVLFNKFANSVAAHGEDVGIPSDAKQVDYEAELVIVMGKKAKKVERNEALSYVFGFCAANDVSARDLQMRTPQWLLGKCCDGFSPLGPYLVTSDEVGNPNELGIRTYLNGEIRQNSNTLDMIFHCDEIVSYISQYMTLEPGDIILTGTPEGVILGYPEDKRVWLKHGDVVTVEIDKLGRLTNRFIDEL